MTGAPSCQLTESRANRILILLLVMASLARMYGVDYHGLWADELWGLSDATRPSFFGTLYRVYMYDGHPPGYHIILRTMVALFGDSEVMLRLPSVLAGVLLVWAAFSLAANYFTRQVGVLAAALVAFSYMAIYYSQEARSNMILTLASVLFVMALLNVVVAGSRTGLAHLALAASAACCAWLHYAGLVFAGCGYLVLLLAVLARRTKEDVRFFVVACLYFLLLYLPWLPVFWKHLHWHSGEQWLRPDAAIAWETACFLLGPKPWVTAVYTGLVLLAPVLAWWPASRREPVHIKVIAVLIVMALLPITVFFVKSMISYSVYNYRNFIAALPLLLILAAYSLSAMVALVFRNKLALPALFLLLGAVVYLQVWQAMHTEPYHLYKGQDTHQFREAVDILARRHINTETTAIVASHDFFDYYLAHRRMRAVANYYFQYDQNLPALQAYLRERNFQDFYYLVIVENNRQSRPPAIDALRAHYHAFCVSHLDWVDVWHFSMEPPVPPNEPPLCQVQGGKD